MAGDEGDGAEDGVRMGWEGGTGRVTRENWRGRVTKEQDEDSLLTTQY